MIESAKINGRKIVEFSGICHAARCAIHIAFTS